MTRAWSTPPEPLRKRAVKWVRTVYVMGVGSWTFTRREGECPLRMTPVRVREDEVADPIA